MIKPFLVLLFPFLILAKALPFEKGRDDITRVNAILEE